MLQHQASIESQNKENDAMSSVVRRKQVGSGLKQVNERSTMSGKASPAASPSSKKMRLMQDVGRSASTTPITKSLGLKDITNSALKTINSTRSRQVTDSIAPRLLVESKKRPLSSLNGGYITAPPSKLHIMNTASELDFSSMPDDQIPDIEYVPIEPNQACESSDSDIFDQFDFSFLTQQPAPPAEPLIDLKKAFETAEFESELSLLSVADKHEHSSPQGIVSIYQ